ncbi:MAG: hypothetical protein WCG91_03335 [Candidatus Shapirobacteria bacterium]
MPIENNNPISKEIVKNETDNSERMEKSAALLENPIKDGEIGYDKVFIQADSIVQDGNKWQVNINSEDSTVILDDKWRKDLGLDASAIVPDIRNGDGTKKLVSGGTWVWIENNQGQRFLTLMRRDAGAPVDTNCLTGPAGRCGEKLSKTSVDETNQELIFLQLEKDGKIKLLAFYRNEEEKEKVVEEKLRQVGEMYKVLMEKGREEDAKYLADNIRSGEDIELLEMGRFEDKDSQLDEITMTIDGREVDKVKGIAYMDEKNKTLEVREVVNIKLPEGVNLAKVMDGEVFLRPTVLVEEGGFEALKSDDLVPALRNYVEKVVGK